MQSQKEDNNNNRTTMLTIQTDFSSSGDNVLTIRPVPATNILSVCFVDSESVLTTGLPTKSNKLISSTCVAADNTLQKMKLLEYCQQQYPPSLSKVCLRKSQVEQQYIWLVHYFTCYNHVYNLIYLRHSRDITTFRTNIERV